LSNINTVTISGNLTRDPELRHTKSDTAVCNISVAVNRSVKRDDEWVEEPSFFDVTVFGGRGEQCAAKCAKGSFVTVSGRLEQQRWETEEGDKRQKVVIIAQQIEGADFFKKRDESAASTPAESGTAAAADDDIPF